MTSALEVAGHVATQSLRLAWYYGLNRAVEQRSQRLATPRRYKPARWRT